MTRIHEKCSSIFASLRPHHSSLAQEFACESHVARELRARLVHAHATLLVSCTVCTIARLDWWTSGLDTELSISPLQFCPYWLVVAQWFKICCINYSNSTIILYWKTILSPYFHNQFWGPSSVVTRI